MNKKNHNEGHTVAIGLGVAAIAAAAAGAYFLYGSTKGPARRKALKTWMVKMKGEVMEEIEKMKDLSEDVYYAAVDKIAEKYHEAKNVDEAELKAVVKRLKGHWKDIKKEAEAGVKKSLKKPLRS
ncbi:MAG: hypothetical protein Q7S72_00980 [Candidatus Taylorbacteria bacterium]|nr:hypothetical protein [Candidatus Taylorbacteria bacterium]